MPIEALTQLTGTALAIGVLVYMINYFMKRDEKREEFVIKVIQDNTNALRELRDIIRKDEK